MGSYNRVAAQLITLLTLVVSIMAALRTADDKRLKVEVTIERLQSQTDPATDQTIVRRRSPQ